MRAVIVEDSRLARAELKTLLAVHPEVEVVAEASNSAEAEVMICQYGPELVFLDIHLPGRDGFELLAGLEVVPCIIFTTAYEEYAVRAFDVGAVDYLLKPIRPQRLAQALERLSGLDTEATSPEDSEVLAIENRILIKDGDRYHLVELASIRCFENCGNYTRVYFDDQTPLIYRSLKKLETRLPTQLFVRVNRQQIVNLRFVSQVEPWFNGGLQLTMDDGRGIEVSRRHASRLRALFSL